MICKNNLLTVLILLANVCLAQQSNISEVESIAAPLVEKLRLSGTERVLLQTDKTFYAQGETLWFKAYIVDSLNNRINYSNRILFVDLVDDKDSVISQVLLHGDRGNTDGSIALNDTLLQGYYWLRGYTKKMAGQNSNNIGIQSVYIANNKRKENDFTTVQANEASPVTTAGIVANIYPEGGWLISGTSSVVAVKVHDRSGKVLALPGVVKDSRDTVVATFLTNKQGTARFSFTPKWYGKYKVYIKDRDRYDSVAVLPRVNPFAAQLSVLEQTQEAIKVRVMLEDSIFTRDYTTYIIGLSKDSICFAGIGKGMYETMIPVSGFPGGIASLILFNEKKELVSIRNIYVDKKNVTININTNKQTYAARENVKMDIVVTDAAGKPLPASFFISVVDAAIADTNQIFAGNAFANLTPTEKDLVMLTDAEKNANLVKLQKREKKVVTDGTPDDLKLNGKVIANKNLPVEGVEVMLMSNEKNPLLQIEKTDASGRFSFSLPDYMDGTQFNLQVKNIDAQRQEYKIMTEPLIFPHFPTPAMLKDKSVNETIRANQVVIHRIDSILTNRHFISLLPVTVKATDTKQGGKSKKANSGVITQEMLQAGGVNNVGQAVLRSGKFHLISNYLMSGGSNGFAPSASDEPIVIMDGNQISVASDNLEVSPVLSYLKTIPTNEIEYIRLLTGNEGTSYGVRGGHGVIEIHSANKLHTDVAAAKVATTIAPKGFHEPATFVMPDYENKEIRKSKTPDLRTTLYWNGDVITDNQGKAQVSFFTADLPATYIIKVGGITVHGDTFLQTTTIKTE